MERIRKTGEDRLPGLLAALVFVGFGAGWGLSTDAALGAALVVLGCFVGVLFFFRAGSLSIPRSTLPLMAVFGFLLIWVPVWLLPWPRGLLEFLSPFRFGVFGLEEGRSIYFGGQDALAWLACAWGVAGSFWVGLRVGRGRTLRWFLWTLVISGTLLAAVMVALFFMGVGMDPGVAHAGDLRLRGPYPNPDRFACWLGMLIVLGMGVTLESEKKGLVVGSAAVLLLFAAALLTGSRGVFLGFVVMLILMGVMLRRWRRFGPMFIPLAAGMAVIVTAGAWGMAGRLMTLPAQYNKVVVWKSALPMWRDFAGIGVGPGSFYRIYSWYQPAGSGGFYSHLHNEIMEIPMELGVPGILLLAALGWWLLRFLRESVLGRVRWGEPLSVTVALAVLLPVFHSSFDFPLRQPANLFLWSALLGILAGRMAAYRIEAEIKAPSRAPAAIIIPLLLGGGALAAAGAAADGGEEGLLDAARRLPPGERYLARAQEKMYPGLLRGRVPPERFGVLDEVVVREAGEDPFVLFRSAVYCSMTGRPMEADRRMLLAARGGRGYRGLNHAVASFFWERFRVSGGRYNIFFRSARAIIELYPGEEINWVEAFLRNGIPEPVCRNLLDDRLLVTYARVLLRLRMEEEALERLKEAAAAGDARALPCLAGMLLVKGEKGKGVRIWRQALGHEDLPFELFSQSVKEFRIDDPDILRPLAERSGARPSRLRWFIARIRKTDIETAFVASANLAGLTGRADDIVLFAGLAARTGRTDIAWKTLTGSLQRKPSEKRLWESVVRLASSERPDLLPMRMAALEPARAPAGVRGELAQLYYRKGYPAAAIMMAESALEDGYMNINLLKTLASSYRSMDMEDCSAALSTLVEACREDIRMRPGETTK